MANERLETHFWFDGKAWILYSERVFDIRRFTEWFGPPSRLGRGGDVAWWDEVPADSLRVRRRVKRASRPQTPAQIAGLERMRAAKMKPGKTDQPE